MLDKRYCFRLVLGSILFGIIVFGKEVYNSGNWRAAGLLWVLYGTVGFGLLFHLLFSNIVKRTDKDEQNN